MRIVSRYLLLFSGAAALAIGGYFIASELLRSYPSQTGIAILAVVAGLLVAAWIKDLHLARAALRLLSLAGLDLALLALIVASNRQPSTGQAVRLTLVAILALIFLLRLRPYLTIGDARGVAAMFLGYLSMSIALLCAFYLAFVVGGVGVLAAYAITSSILIWITPGPRRARVSGFLIWAGIIVTLVWSAYSLVEYLRGSAPHERGCVAVVAILSAFVIISLLRFRTIDAFVKRLGEWLRG